MNEPGSIEPPRYGFLPIERRVNARLSDRRLLPKVVSVVAAPGYGKTVLLSQLHSAYLAQGLDCVWVGLNERDNDSKTFLAVLEQALGVDGDIKNTHVRDAVGVRVRRLVEHLNGRHSPLVVFIDQLDAASTEEFGSVLDALIFGTSQAVRFVMASTRPLPISRSRIKLELGLIDIEEADLALECKDIAELLSTAGVKGADCDVATLVHKKTEGWPAALRLIQIMMANEGASPAILERFSGSDHDLASLLSRRMLKGFEPDFVQFLFEIAQLKSFSASLALFALESERSTEFIGLLSRLHVPLVPLDGANEWFRFHKLIREFLISEAGLKLTSERRARILARAALWHAERGEAVAAFDYAVEAGEFEMASGLLDKIAQATVADRGQLKDYLRWYAVVEAAGVPIGFSARFWYAWTLQLSHQYGLAFQALSAFLNDCANSPDAKFLLPRAEFLLITSATTSDNGDQVFQDCKRWLSKYRGTADPFQTALIEGCISCVHLARESLSEALKAQSASQALLVNGQNEFAAVFGMSIRAIILFEAGDVIEAERLLASAVERTRSSLGPDATVLSVLCLVQSSVLFELGRDDDARAALEVGLTHAGCDAAIFALRYGFESGVRLLPDEFSGGASIQALEQIASRYPPRASVLLGALRIRWLALRGRADDAMELAKRLGLTSYGRPEARTSADTSGVERSLLLLAELEIGVFRSDHEAVRDAIEAEIKTVGVARRRRMQVDLYMLLFKLHMTAGRRDLAVRAVSRALAVAGRRQILRPFLDRGPLLRELFSKTRLKEFNLTQQEDISFLRRLLERLGIDERRGAGPESEDATAAHVDPLTPRELELLHSLEAGKTNQQIADQFDLTLPTVKWHLYNLYSKFGVKNRAAALARARGLAILSR